MSDTDAKIVLIGLSGVSETSLQEWAASGLMPSLARLRSESSFGPLVSTRPSGTTVAWSSLLTGRNLPHHGVFDRDFVDVPQGTIRHAGPDRLTSPDLWRLVDPEGDADRRHGDLRLTEFAPMLRKSLVRGFLPLSSGTSSSRAIALTTGSIWKRRPRNVGEAEALAARQIADMELATKVLSRSETGHPWKLLSLRFRCLAGLQRHLWSEFSRQGSTPACHEFEPGVRAVMAALDAAIGRLVAIAEKRGAAIMVVSENGIGPLRSLINVNGILRIHGIQKPAASLQAWMRVGQSLASRTGQRAVRHFFGRQVRKSFEALGARNDCDWSRTLAFAPFGEEAGLVYLTPKARRHNQRSERVTLEIAEIFRLIADPATGNAVFSDVIPVRPRWNVDPDESGWPEIIAVPADGYQPRADWRFKEKARIFRVDSGTPGGVYDTGAYLARNLRFKPDTRPFVRVLDIAPTVLDHLGIPVPESMEGTSLSRPLDRSIYQPHIRPDGSRWTSHADAVYQPYRFPVT